MPAAKSTQRHVLTGTFRRDRHAARTLAPGGKPPRPPAHLTAAAKAIWRETAKALTAAGVLTGLDLTTLERRCVRLDQARQWAKVVESDGPTVTHGELLKPHPLIDKIAAALADVQHCDDRLLMTPVSRMRQGVEQPAPPDEFQRFLDGKPTGDPYLDYQRAHAAAGVMSRDRSRGAADAQETA